MEGDLTVPISDVPPIYVHGIAFWDEHHKKCILGNTSTIERRVYHDEDGNPCSLEDGGFLDENNFVLQ